MSESTEKNERKYPSFGGSASGTRVAYSVEARHMGHYGATYEGQVFDTRWRQLNFKKGVFGVPNGSCLDAIPRLLDLLTWEAAQALRWWFHANLEANPMGGLCWESRIVEHRVTYSYSSEAVTHHEHIGGDNGEFSSRGPREVRKIKIPDIGQSSDGEKVS